MSRQQFKNNKTKSGFLLAVVSYKNAIERENNEEPTDSLLAGWSVGVQASQEPLKWPTFETLNDNVTDTYQEWIWLQTRRTLAWHRGGWHEALKYVDSSSSVRRKTEMKNHKYCLNIFSWKRIIFNPTNIPIWQEKLETMLN